MEMHVSNYLRSVLFVNKSTIREKKLKMEKEKKNLNW